MTRPTNLNQLFSLTGRTAVVTGGTSGIGLMIARGLLLAGASVFIVGRNPTTCKETCQALSSYGQCHFITADISVSKGITTLVETLNNNAPDLSILVNNAGITGHAPLGEYSEALWEDIVTLNLKAPFMLIQALLPLLKKNASGPRPSHIINTGSIAALINSTPNSWAYGPSKAALHHLTKTLAKKLTPEHIHVNAIAPGLFPSKLSAWIMEDDEASSASLQQIPAGRHGEPDDIAGLIIFIAASQYLTGTVLTLDGGLSL